MIKMIFAFIAGALIGGVSGYAVCRHICEKEIQSVKETFHSKIAEQQGWTDNPSAFKDLSDEDLERLRKCKKTALEKSEVERINKILDDMDYSNPENDEEDDTMKPFQINPDEFGEDEAYGQAMLDYYTDGIIVDDEGCVLTNVSIRSLLGISVGDAFNQTDEDVIYVRNPTVMVDYMITRNDRAYYESDPLL